MTEKIILICKILFASLQILQKKNFKSTRTYLWTQNPQLQLAIAGKCSVLLRFMELKLRKNYSKSLKFYPSKAICWL